MTGTEFAELVGWVQDRWGRHDEVWANSSRFARDFEPVDAEDVWAAVFTKGTGQWAPRPAELIHAARENARNRARPERQAQLPAPKGATWAEWCREKFGKRRPFHEVIRERHAELVGKRASTTDAKLPHEMTLLAEGIDPVIECLSPHCEIHRDDPVPFPDDAEPLGVE